MNEPKYDTTQKLPQPYEGPQTVLGPMTLCGTEIVYDDAGRYNLNVLHRAYEAKIGEPVPHKRPSQWLRSAPVQEYVEQVRRYFQAKKDELVGNGQDAHTHFEGKSGTYDPIVTERGGSAPGTFADELIALDYAQWIDAEFRLDVNLTFLKYRKGELDLLRDPLIGRFNELHTAYVKLGASPRQATLDAAVQVHKETNKDVFDLLPEAIRPGVLQNFMDGKRYFKNANLVLEYQYESNEATYDTRGLRDIFNFTLANTYAMLVSEGFLTVTEGKKPKEYYLTEQGLLYGFYESPLGARSEHPVKRGTIKWKVSILKALSVDDKGRKRKPEVNPKTGLPWGEEPPPREAAQPDKDSFAARGVNLGQAMKDYEAARLAYQLGESDYDPDNPPTTEHSDEKLYTGHEARFNFDAIDGAFNMGF